MKYLLRFNDMRNCEKRKYFNILSKEKELHYFNQHFHNKKTLKIIKI